MNNDLSPSSEGSDIELIPINPTVWFANDTVFVPIVDISGNEYLPVKFYSLYTFTTVHFR